jgi:hypothetical protein
MSDVSGTRELRSLVRAYADVVAAQLRIGRDLVQSMTGVAVPDFGSATDLVRKGMPRAACRIPPPCWMPQSLGDCTSHIAECKSATLTFVITNCSTAQRTIAVAVAGLPNATVSPAQLMLGPLERGKVTVVFPAPDGAAAGTEYEGLVRIDGCRDWYLRWTVSIGTVGIGCAHEIRVDDCPDYLHHWYDHFYCPRPCPGGRAAVGHV